MFTRCPGDKGLPNGWYKMPETGEGSRESIAPGEWDFSKGVVLQPLSACSGNRI
jgi:hypothetical protein